MKIKVIKILSFINLCLCFFLISCKNIFELKDEIETINENCYLSISLGNSNRTIAPESLTWNDISEISLLANGTEIKKWNIKEGNTVNTVLESDSQLLINKGIYDFELQLINHNNIVVAIGEIKNKTINPGTNNLIFNTENNKNGTGAVDITLSWVTQDRVGSIKIGIFEYEDNSKPITDFDFETLSISNDECCTKYQKNNIPAGKYYLRYELYSPENTKTRLIKADGDILIIETDRTTTAALGITNINTMYSINYILQDGFTWKEGYIPETVKPIFSKVRLPSANDLTRKAGYFFEGWYDNKDFYGTQITYLEPENNNDITVYLKIHWGIAVDELSRFIMVNPDYTDPIVVEDKAPNISKINEALQSTYTNIQLDLSNCTELNVIDDDAFSYCHSLTNLILPETITSIGNYAFSYCRSLTNLILPESITQISEGTFKNCYNLTNISIPNSVTSIGDYAFINCSNLETITIPDSVTSIGDGAFSYTGLKAINIPETIIKINERTFEFCNNLTDISIPNSVTSIGDYAFANCSNLETITIPDSVTSIGDGAFSGCNLKTINISEALRNKFKDIFVKFDTEITIPYGTTRIEDSEYQECIKLKNINIPETVTSIGNYAFSGCSSLTSITIPDSIIDIGEDIFRGCSNVIDINISDETLYKFLSSFKSIVKSITIPNDTIIIENYAFEDFSNITNIIIPDSVISIGNSAFRGCSKLTSITIPDSVTFIGESAFEGCSKLTSITIPDSVTFIGDSAFEDCEELTSITIPDSVKTLEPRAFSYCKNLSNITLSNTITSINYALFEGCKKLVSIIIPNSVTTIGEAAFGECSGLLNIQLPDSVTFIDEGAFSGCVNLTSIIIPENIETIKGGAFSSCDSLTTIYYKGTQEQWNKIDKEDLEIPPSATIIFEYKE